MFAKLKFIGENQGLVDVNTPMHDMAAIICGETDLNNLSSQVVVGSSYIITDHATSPWELYDDFYTNTYVLRCLQTDSQTYKYISFESAGVPLTASYAMGIMTDWDDTLHTGTDFTGANFVYDNVGVRMDVDESDFYIYADEFMIVIMPVTYYGVYGSLDAATYGCMGCLECSRVNPSLAIGDMPNHFVGSSVAWGTGSLTDKNYRLTFAKGRDYLGNEVAPLRAFGGRPGRGSWWWSTETYVSNSRVTCNIDPSPTQKERRFPAEHLIVGGGQNQTPTYVNSGSFMGSVSDRSDIWAIPPNDDDVTADYEILDILLWRGRKFIVLKSGYHTGTAGLRHGTKFIVPYG
jgi:hypothetical protein